MATVERVREALTEQHLEAGETDVRDLRIGLGADANGDEALFVKLILSVPPDGQETWPVDDLWALRRAIGDILAEVDPERTVPWVVSFEPETGDELAPEDAEDAVETDV